MLLLLLVPGGSRPIAIEIILHACSTLVVEVEFAVCNAPSLITIIAFDELRVSTGIRVVLLERRAGPRKCIHVILLLGLYGLIVINTVQAIGREMLE